MVLFLITGFSDIIFLLFYFSKFLFLSLANDDCVINLASFEIKSELRLLGIFPIFLIKIYIEPLIRLKNKF